MKCYQVCRQQKTHIGLINTTSLPASELEAQLDELNDFFFTTRHSTAYHKRHIFFMTQMWGQQAVPEDTQGRRVTFTWRAVHCPKGSAGSACRG